MLEVARCLSLSVCRTPCPQQQRTLQQNNLAPPTPSSVVFPDQLRSFRDIYWHLYWHICWYVYCFAQYPSFCTNWTSSMNCSSFKSLRQKLDLTTLVFKVKQKDAYVFHDIHLPTLIIDWLLLPRGQRDIFPFCLTWGVEAGVLMFNQSWICDTYSLYLWIVAKRYLLPRTSLTCCKSFALKTCLAL